MEPVALATLTTAITCLGIEVCKGMATEAGKDAWKKIKSLFGWQSEPPQGDLAATVAKTLEANEALAKQIVEILQSQQTGAASQMVGTINAQKVIVANKIDTVNM